MIKNSRGNKFHAVAADGAVDWDHPLNRGRVAWWLAPPGTPAAGSQMLNLCANKYHGTLTSFAAGDVPWTADRFGFGALTTTGTQYLNTAIINGSTIYTLSAVVDLAAASTAGQIIGNDNGGGGNDRGWQFRQDASTGNLRLIAFSSGATNDQAVGTSDLRGAGRKHVVGTWDGTTISVYVDGALEGTTPFAGPFTNTTLQNVTLAAAIPASSSDDGNNLTGKIISASIHSGIAWPVGLVREDYRMSRMGWQVPDSPLRWVSTSTYSVPAAAVTLPFNNFPMMPAI